MRNPFDPGYYCSEELRGFGFKAVGENVRIARNCTIIGPENIEVGDHVRIDGYTSIIATTGKLRIGNRIHIGGHCHFCVAADLTFGDLGGTSQGVRIYTSTDDYSGQHLMGPMVPEEYRGATTAPVTVGKFAVIGSSSVILPGVTVAEGSVVGALSLVTKSLDPWGVYFGSPAKRLKNRSRRILSMESEMMGLERAA